jgi:hypothetical protein
VKDNLWYQAYALCFTEQHRRDGKTLDELEEVLILKDTPTGVADQAQCKSREDRFRMLNTALESSLPGRIQEIEDHRWPIPLTNGQMDFGDVVEKFVDVVAMAKDFVGGALSANPTASLAWSGVCFGIQVSQKNNTIGGKLGKFQF